MVTLQKIKDTTFGDLEIGDAFFLPSFRPSPAYSVPPIFVKAIARNVEVGDGNKRMVNADRMNIEQARFFGDSEKVVHVNITTKPATA